FYFISFTSSLYHLSLSFFFFHAPAPTQIYTLSLHDALPICLPTSTLFHPIPLRCSCDRREPSQALGPETGSYDASTAIDGTRRQDRKSTRLNSSHVSISYAVFCLKKKKNKTNKIQLDTIISN